MLFSQIISRFSLTEDNASAFWEITTDFTTRPIRLLLDTGAQVTIVSEDVILPTVTIHPFYIALIGINGINYAISTRGSLNGSFITENGTHWPTEIHTLNRENVGQFDGYLGLDFMRIYGADIKFSDNTLILHSGAGDEIQLNHENKNLLPLPNHFEEQDLDASPDGEATTPSVPEMKNQRSIAENAPYQKDIPLNPQIYSPSSESAQNNIHNKSTSLELPEKHVENTSTLEAPVSTEKQAKHMKALLADIKMKTFTDADDDITKLKRIASYNLNFNHQAKSYVKYFGAKKFHVSNQTPKLNRFKVFANNLLPRTQLILQNLKLTHTTDQQRSEIKKIVENFPQQFYVSGDTLAQTNLITHSIHLKPGTGIINVKQFRLPETQKISINKATAQLYREHLIRDSTSPFNFPTFMVPKKDEFGEKTDERQVFDYKQLNAATIIQNFPIPLVQELVDSFSKAKFISKLDMERAYNQIPMREEHKHLTAFTVQFKKYEHNRMPFGLSGAPTTMQSGIVTLLHDLLENGVNVYMDDISIQTETLQEHLDLINEIFKRLKTHNLQVKIKKCEFFARELDYLGFIISPGKVAPNPAKTKVIANFPTPRNRKEVQSFLGMCNYFRHFIKDYSKIARPMTRLTSINANFEWSNAATQAFQSLKRILTEDVTLSIVDFAKPFILATDASDFAIGAVLTQEHNKKERPIYFYSRVLNEHEENYPTHEKELLAIVASIEEFDTYLRGRKFTVKTDSQCLVYLFSDPHRNKRLVRQAINILDANFDIVYQPGKLNVVADALSRIKFSDPEEWHTVPVTEFISRHVQITKAAKTLIRQKATSFCSPICRIKVAAHVRVEPGQVKLSRYQHTYTLVSTLNRRVLSKYFNDPDQIKTNILRKITKDHSIFIVKSIPVTQEEISEATKIIESHSSKNSFSNIAIETDFKAKALFSLKFELQSAFDQNKISCSIHTNDIIELSDRNEIEKALEMHHNLRLGGHAGIHRMKDTMKQIYFWPTMTSDIKKFVNECPICEKAKITKYTRMPMQITSTGTKPFEHVYLDHVGPITPVSTEGYKHIFVATCDLTKFSIAVPVMDTAANTTADVFIKHIVLVFGFPAEVSHDGGPAFTSDLFKEINRKLKIKDITSTPYNPRANIVERRNRSTAEYLKCYTQLKPQTWAELLPYATFSYNITTNSTTGFSPFELVYGKKVTLPDSLTKRQPIYNYDNFADLVKREFADAWQLARDKIAKAKEVNKKYYDRATNIIKFKVGDRILVKKIIKDRKFDFAWKGPFEILETHEKYVIYKEGNKKKKINMDYIKLAKSVKFLENIPEQQITMLRKIYCIKRNFDISL